MTTQFPTEIDDFYNPDPNAPLVQVINLAFWDRNHCRDSFEAEQRGKKC